MRKKTTTKEKILHVLKKDNEISIKDLTDYFTISEVAIRRHLNDLIRQKFVKERIVKQEIGRPYHLYSLTGQGHDTFPNQYEELPVELLKDLEMLQGKSVVNDLLLKRKEREEKELTEKLSEENFDTKVEKLLEIQERKGYMFEFEKTDDGNYKVKNFNCPIYNLANHYRQVCTNEKDMYRTVFPDSEIVAESCMTAGNKYCCWVITKPE